MKMLGIIAIVAVAFFSLIALADVAQATDGQEVYKAKCAMCHGASGMGYEALARALKIEQSQFDLTKPEMKQHT